MAPVKTIDEYIQTFSPPVRKLLEKLRQTIRESAPEAEEVISYQMPAFKYNGMLVYFAAWKNHIGFYPAGALKAFDKELSVYEVSKGTIRFPINKPLPLGLISKIVKFRVKQNEEKISLKKSNGKK